MSSQLPPVPHKAPVIDKTGIPTPVWADWFKQLFFRVGGHVAETNLELVPVTTDRLVDGAVTTPKVLDANITLSKLAAAVAAALVPAGSLLAYGGASAPTGYLLCDGSAISRSTYSALFSAIGTAFGSGDGSTTFNLPNTQGIFLRGAGSQTIGGIAYSAILGAAQGDQMQGHFHSASTNAAVDNGAHGSAGTGFDYCNSGASVTVGAPTTDGSNGTPRTGSETRPANQATNWIIKT